MVSCQSELTGSELRAQATKPLKRTHDVRLNRDLHAIDQLASCGKVDELASVARKIARRAHYLRYAVQEAVQDAVQEARG